MHRSLTSGFLVFAALTSTAGVALASKTVIKAKGADATGSFEVRKEQACLGGGTAVSTTLVHFSMFESTTTTNGVANTVLVSTFAVDRFDGCNSVFSLGFGQFQGVGNLTMQGLTTGKITGHFPLDDGTELDVNLTLTGSDTMTLGMRSQRSLLGKVMVIERSTGTTRTATLSGTITVDGENISAAQMTSPEGMLARNTGGEITIMKP